MPKHPNQNIPWITITTALAIALMLGFAHAVKPAGRAPTHNAAEGYIDACGELPGMVGDDC